MKRWVLWSIVLALVIAGALLAFDRLHPFKGQLDARLHVARFSDEMTAIAERFRKDNELLSVVVYGPEDIVFSRLEDLPLEDGSDFEPRKVVSSFWGDEAGDLTQIYWDLYESSYPRIGIIGRSKQNKPFFLGPEYFSGNYHMYSYLVYAFEDADNFPNCPSVPVGESGSCYMKINDYWMLHYYWRDRQPYEDLDHEASDDGRR